MIFSSCEPGRLGVWNFQNLLTKTNNKWKIQKLNETVSHFLALSNNSCKNNMIVENYEISRRNIKSKHFNPFLVHTRISFIPPENTRKPNFLVFLGGIKWEHWREMIELIDWKMRNWIEKWLIELGFLFIVHHSTWSIRLLLLSSCNIQI